MSNGEKIELEAALWLAKIDAGLKPDGERAFERWVAQSTSHRIAFLRVETAWDNADRLAALKRPADPAGRSVDRSDRRFGTQLAAAVLVVTLGSAAVVGSLYFAEAPPTVYTTRSGQHDSVRLADGTKIELNGGTSMQAAVNGTARTVSLQQGGAYFDVVHDAKRPFTVMVGKHRITDIGTKFTVVRKGDDAEIVVKEGRVRVDTVGTASPRAPVFADGGSIVLARADETLVATKPAETVSGELDWRNDRLTFNQETLSDAAAEFNRYNQTKIVVRGKARNIRIGGSFRQENIESFASLIHEGFGVTVRRRENEIIVSN